MTTTDSVEHTRRLAEAALAAMSRLDIAPTPNNFLIWYNDCSGGCLELSRRLRHLESGGEMFTEELLAELYETFFGTGREVVRLLNETCARIETAMAHLHSQVAGMTRDAGSYGAKLASFGQALRSHDQSGELHALVGAILEETRRMQRQAQQLEVQLQESSARVEDLRAELTSAQREASTDSLTGIANRKYFDHALRLAAEEALASARPLCLLLADIDHFKQFNDTYGHQVGEQMLGCNAAERDDTKDQAFLPFSTSSMECG
jgi:diguanylate cyclase